MNRRLDTIEYTCWGEGDLYCISTRYFGGELFGAKSTDSYSAAIQEFIGKCEAVIDEKYLPANWSNEKKYFEAWNNKFMSS